MYNGLLDSPALYNAGIYIRLSQEDKDKDKKKKDKEKEKKKNKTDLPDIEIADHNP